MINHSSSVKLLEYISVSSLFYFFHYKKRYQMGSIEIVENIDDKDSLSGKELDQLKEELYLLAAYISEVSEDETIKNPKASVLIQNSTVTVQSNERGDNIAQDKIEGDKVGRDRITDSR
jgi:hypothetical protein